MEADITQLYRDYWNDNLELKFQQTKSRLRPFVTERTQIGLFDYFNRIGVTDPKEKTGENQDIEYSETEEDTRCVFTKPIYWSKLLDTQVIEAAVKDPSSEYLMAANATLNRGIDKTVLTAGLGIALTGKTGQIPIALPKSQIIPVNYKWTGAPANSNLTEEKLRKIRSMFGKSEAFDEEDDAGEGLFIAYAQSQQDALMAIEKVVNKDYTQQENLRQGKPSSWMGFTFIRTELVPVDKDTGYRRCMAFSRRGIKLSFKGAPVRRVDEVITKHFSKQLYAGIEVGAVRTWEEKVVEVLCDEAK